jgi:Domain of unknown function (DUF4118)
LAHFVTDKIVVGLQRAALVLGALTVVSVVASMAFTRTADALLSALTVSMLTFGIPGIGVFVLSYWLEGQTAKIEGHPRERRLAARDDDANHPFRAPVAGYAIAIGATACSWALRAIIDPYLPGSVPFVTFFLAIAVGGWFGGYGPAALAVALSAVIARYFYMEPLYGWLPGDASSAIRLGSFVFVGLMIGGLTAALCAALRRVTHLAAKVTEFEAERRRDSTN